jgi:hypothetical protein
MLDSPPGAFVTYRGYLTTQTRRVESRKLCARKVGIPGEFMNRLLIVAILMLLTAPLYAQGQQQNVAKLKEDARNAVGIIGADRGKTQNLLPNCRPPRAAAWAGRSGEEQKKTKALLQRIDQLQKKLGPEFVVLENILTDIDLKSDDGREIALIIQGLNESCPE